MKTYNTQSIHLYLNTKEVWLGEASYVCHYFNVNELVILQLQGIHIQDMRLTLCFGWLLAIVLYYIISLNIRFILIVI